MTNMNNMTNMPTITTNPPPNAPPKQCAAGLLPSIERTSRLISSGERHRPLKYLKDGERFFTEQGGEFDAAFIARIQTFFVFIAVELENVEKEVILHQQSTCAKRPEEVAKHWHAYQGHQRKADYYARQLAMIVKHQAMVDSGYRGPLPALGQRGGDFSV